MQMNQNLSNLNNNQNIRKKRVQKIKILIILSVVLLLFSSLILNFVLIFKVLHFEECIHNLYSSNDLYISFI